MFFDLRDFKDLAIKILNECYLTNAKQTEDMITRKLTQFPGHTCLSLAYCSGQEEFVAHNSVQQLLNDVWRGNLKTREVSTFSLVIAIFFPPLVWKFEFRNKKESENVAQVKDGFEDEEEEDAKLENESSDNKVMEMSE